MKSSKGQASPDEWRAGFKAKKHPRTETVMGLNGKDPWRSIEDKLRHSKIERVSQCPNDPNTIVFDYLRGLDDQRMRMIVKFTNLGMWVDWCGERKP